MKKVLNIKLKELYDYKSRLRELIEGNYIDNEFYLSELHITNSQIFLLLEIRHSVNNMKG